MPARTTAILAAIPALIFSQTAAAAPLCADLKKLVAAATETPHFQSVATFGKGPLDPAVTHVLPQGFKACDAMRMRPAAKADFYYCETARGVTQPENTKTFTRLSAEIGKCFAVKGRLVTRNMLTNAGTVTGFPVTTPAGRVMVSLHEAIPDKPKRHVEVRIEQVGADYYLPNSQTRVP